MVQHKTKFKYIEREFAELEFAIAQDDMAISHILSALFPKETQYISRAIRFDKDMKVSESYPSLFDEYTNQYFSSLMSALEKLPFRGMN